MNRAEQRSAGRALRRDVPRSRHGEWRASNDRPDPVDELIASNEGRLAELVPVRHARMTASPFAYYRGAPAMMAADLRRTLTTGIALQLCGDAHLLNFGSYATPERNVVFDVNDFDETERGPWEWDLKRLAASLTIAARTAGLTDDDGRAAALSCAGAYRSEIAAMAELSAFEVWHARFDAAVLLAGAPDQRSRTYVERGLVKARQRTSLQALAKLTSVVDGRRVIVEDPPLVTRLTDQQLAQAHRSVDAYLATLDPDRRLLLDRYEVVDAALKVVGVGSVGTRCFIVLLAGRADLDPLFLQIKEARASVLAPHVAGAWRGNQGERVVVGQRIMQAASDVFLGWARADGFDLYVRQLRDMKLSVRLDDVRPEALAIYGRLCGATLARAHARAGEPALLAGYLGRGASFDEAIATFALAYADQNERDYDAFLAAIRSGRLECSP